MMWMVRHTHLMLAGLFAVYGSLAVLLLASIVPPYMNPDEGAHFARADQVAHGGLVARGGVGAPALIDSNVISSGGRFSVLVSDRALRVPRALYAPAEWGPRIVPGSPNTALYPPMLYAPAAVAIRLGQRAGLTVLPTLELARGAMGLASVAIGAAAIALAGPAAVWLFAILTLPMSLSQMGALSQDGPMIALAALAAAAWLRLQDTGRPRAWLAGLCVCLALIGMARPPYVALAAMAVLVPGVARGWRWAAAGFVVAMVGGWSAVALVGTHVDLMHYAGSEAGAQMTGLLWAPWRVPVVAWNTMAVHYGNYAQQFVGQLGWLDVVLPDRYRLAADGVLGLAGVCAWRAGRGAWSGRRAAALGGAVLAAAVLMFAIQYLTWTKVGWDTVEGVQGRYFLPLALVLGGVFTRPVMSGSRTAAVGSAGVMVFGVMGIVVMLHAILLRYYL